MLRTSEDFIWSAEFAYHGRFIAEVEFLDLKVCPKNVSLINVSLLKSKAVIYLIGINLCIKPLNKVCIARPLIKPRTSCTLTLRPSLVTFDCLLHRELLRERFLFPDFIILISFFCDTG